MKTIVAHVGHNGSMDDMARIVESMEWCRKHDAKWPVKSDLIDLAIGRDFLAEKKKYDAVVLHFIFRGGFHILNGVTPCLTISPSSSWSGWRKRLVQSGAKLIFAFGGVAEIGGTFICHLDGYEAIKIRTEDPANFGNRELGHDGFWIFKKL